MAIVDTLKEKFNVAGGTIDEVLKQITPGSDRTFDPFIVTVEASAVGDSWTWEVSSVDKTVTEIREAVNAGKTPIVKMNMTDGYMHLTDTCYAILCSGLSSVNGFYAEFLSSINYIQNANSLSVGKFYLVLSSMDGNVLYRFATTLS